MGFLSGLKILFEPKLVSALSPKNGEWLMTSAFDTPSRAILFDGETGNTIIISPKKNGDGYDEKPIKGMVSLITLTYPEQHQLIDFTWDELIKNVSTIDEAQKLKNSAGEKKFTAVSGFEFSEVKIGTRKEKVKSLRRREIHPINITFLTSDAEFYVAIVQVTTKVLNPFQALQLNFLNAVTIKIDEAITNWGKANNFLEARKLNADSATQIIIKDKPYIEAINTDLEKKYGVIIEGVDIVDFFPGDKSKARVESEQKIAQKENEAKAAVNETKRRLTLLEATKEENDAQITLANGLTDAWAKAQVKVNASMKDVVGAYGGKVTYLNTGGQNTNQLNFEDIMAAMELSKKKGGPS